MTDQKKDLALFGDGNGNHLSNEQLLMIDTLYENVSSLRNDLVDTVPEDADFCDHETCRRYLVARSWDIDAAQKQLESTLTWRKEELYPLQKKEFHESPKTLNNPLALSLRTIGCDKDGRPIMYTCFAEAHDRWDVEGNMTHQTLCMEACCKLLRKRRSEGLNQTAASRQWILAIDFDGFGWRDQNPNVAVLTIKLLQHYPEMLHNFLLVNSPYLFLGLYKVITPLLDERVKAKVQFLKFTSKTKGKKNNAFDQLENRLGSEFVKWIYNEIEDNRFKRKSKEPKKYWENVVVLSDDESELPESNEQKHDSRGLESYVGTNMYIKTPGDAYKAQW